MTTQAVAARIVTCEVAAPQMRPNAPRLVKTRTASAATTVPLADAKAVSPPHTVESSAKPIIDAKRARFEPAASARQVQNAPIAAHAKTGSCSKLPSASIAVDAHAARKPSERLASLAENDTIHTGRLR